MRAINSVILQRISKRALEKLMTPFGRAFELARRKRGLLQKQVAIAAGVAPAFICDIEAGRRRPSKEMLEVLAKALGLSEQEVEGLAQAAKLSCRTRMVPDGISLDEYEMLEVLWSRLGQLTLGQIKAVTEILQLRIPHQDTWVRESYLGANREDKAM